MLLLCLSPTFLRCLHLCLTSLIITKLRYHDERCQAEARTDEERRAGTQGKRERETSHYSLLKVLSRLFSLADLYPLSGFDC